MSKLKANFLLLFLALTLSGLAQKPTDKRLSGLDTVVARILKDWKAPGVSIAVVEKNKVVYTGGFGYRDLEKKLPVTEHTLFAIGSCTKAFTSSLLGMLVKEGRVDLDKPVRNYLPELKFVNDQLNNHVTLRDMMCHRTGLPRHDYSWYGSTASRMELLRRIEYLEPTAELRAKYQYNNFMFMSQGVVLEKLTGKSWEENIKERIFKPLGMDQTVTDVSGMEKSGDRSLAYALIRDSVALAIPYRNIDAIGPAGSINSSARDMARWLITWIGGGKYEGKEILPADYVRDAMTNQMATGGLPSTDNPDIQGIGYGLAWGLASYRGHYRVEHGGGIDGFISTTGFFPLDSIGIYVVSCNGQVTSSVRNWIADRMLGLPYRDWHKQSRDAYVKGRFTAMMTPKPNDSTGRVFNTKPSLPLGDYAGKYTHKGYGSMEVTLVGQQLRAQYNGMSLPLNHKHFDIFRGRPEGPQYEDGTDTELFFALSKEGKVKSLSTPLQPGLADMVFEKELIAAPLTRADLEKYAGEYLLGPQQISFVIRNNTTLFALLPPQPDCELVPSGKDEFKLKIMDGFSVKFKLNDQGKAIEAAFVQPNGVFTAKRKE
ncbi:MAG TPA: serine hydrolase [Saprospiraceae bacterium]|nr:serine hydrolase [Saprospiraceae bacterium]HNT22433.1 serine hydrolase [Saprospiraceae bacterium]